MRFSLVLALVASMEVTEEESLVSDGAFDGLSNMNGLVW